MGKKRKETFDKTWRNDFFFIRMIHQAIQIHLQTVFPTMWSFLAKTRIFVWKLRDIKCLIQLVTLICIHAIGYLVCNRIFLLASVFLNFPRCICDKHIWIKYFQSNLDGFIFVCHSTFHSQSTILTILHITISISLANF